MAQKVQNKKIYGANYAEMEKKDKRKKITCNRIQNNEMIYIKNV